MCTRITRTYQARSRFCLFHTNPARVVSGWSKPCLKKNRIQMKKCAATTSEGEIAKCFIEARPEVHHNTTRSRTSLCVLCKQTYYYGSKQQEEAVPICCATTICTSIILQLLSLYLRRVGMIRNRYMRKDVVRVPMSRNVTTAWVLTWIPNLSV